MAPEAKSVDGYVEGLGEPRAAVARRLREAVRAAAPEAKESVKYGQLVYESDGPFAALKGMPRWVTLTFWRGAAMAAEPELAPLLDGEGDRMRHHRFGTVEDVRDDEVAALVRRAVTMNAELGDPTKRG
jgi:hypothetical protein